MNSFRWHLWLLYSKQARNYMSRKSEKLLDKQHWLWAFSHAQQKAYDAEKVGKWMLFIRQEHVNEVWEKIRQATEQGLLGICCKVATAMHNSPQARSETSKLICVYTYDYDDQADVRRILAALRTL